MQNLMARLTIPFLLCLGLAACVTHKDQVLAPDAAGVAINARAGRPVEGARVRFARSNAPASVITGADGRFALQGRTQGRIILAYPIGGVFRDTTSVMASAPGLGNAYASVDFINAGRPASGIRDIPILMFEADAAETPLHALMADCIGSAEEQHALRIATHVSTLDPAMPPGWLTADRAGAVLDHLNRIYPFSRFQTCQQASDAYALYSSATTVLETLISRAP